MEVPKICWNGALQLLRTVEIGGEVDAMLLESGMLFVGLHMSGEKAAIKSLPGSIKVFNLQAGSESLLQGHLVRPTLIAPKSMPS